MVTSLVPSPNSSSSFSSASAFESVPAAKPASSSSAGPLLVPADAAPAVRNLAPAGAARLPAAGFEAPAGGLAAGAFVFLIPSALTGSEPCSGQGKQHNFRGSHCCQVVAKCT